MTLSKTGKPVHPKVAAPAGIGTAIAGLATVASAVGIVIPADVSTAAVAAISGGIVVVQFVAGFLKRA